jgi:translocation and assembly module TamB
MAQEQLATGPPPRRRRRWWKFLVLLGVLALLASAALVAALPWWLSSEPGRRWLLARASAALAPARLEVAGFQWSWFGPTRMTGFVLRDHQGDAVVTAPTAVWDRSLWQALFERPRYGTLRLPAASLDVEREADQRVDLLEALRPVLTKNPRAAFVIRVDGGRLRFRDPALAEPLTGEKLGILIDRPADPRPLSFQVRIDGADGARLEFDGRLDKTVKADGAPDDLDVNVRAARWPMALRLGGGADDPALIARGALDGRGVASRRGGRWHTDGDAALLGLALEGRALRGDRPRWERVEAAWNLERQGDGWRVERLAIEAPGASLSASGLIPAPPGGTAHLDGRIDLAALARQLPQTLRIREGWTLESGAAVVRAEAVAMGDGAATAWNVSAQVEDIVASDEQSRIAFERPARLDARVVQSRSGARVERFGVESAFLTASGRGDVDRGITLDGSLDFAELKREFGDLIDFGPLAPATARFAAFYRRSGETYQGRLAIETDAQHRDDRAVQHEPAHLVGFLEGPATPVGWPSGWRRLWASGETGSWTGELTAEADEAGASSLIAHLELAAGAGTLSMDVEARRDEANWTIPAARLSAGPHGQADGQLGAEQARIQLVASGRYDADADELSLRPGAAEDGSALVLAPEGLRLRGVRSGNWRGEVVLLGNVAALDQIIASWADSTPMGFTGTCALRGSAEGNRDGWRLRASLAANDLAHGGDEPGAVSLGIAAASGPDTRSVEIQELVLATRFATLDAAGRLDDPLGARYLDVRGTLRPDWDELSAWLARRVEPNATVRGRPHAFRVQGPLSGDDAIDRLEAEVGIALDELDIYGMRTGPIPLVARWRDGHAEIDPIDTTLNGGRVSVSPELVRGEDGTWTLRVAPGARVEDAEVNDVVSHRVLAYVAPVLDKATRVRGRVSARIERAEVPLGGDAARRAVVEGAVVFQDVRFAPGPLAMQLYDIVGIEPTTLRLDQPVVLAVADGMVYQRGFSMPLGNIARVQMEGTVGFDRSLNLDVSLPLATERMADRPLLARLASAARLTIPVRGTLDDPRIDREAMGQALRRMGTDVAATAGVNGLESLIRGLATPRDPEEVARLQAEREERQRLRRAEQQRKQEERRARRAERRRLRDGS